MSVSQGGFLSASNETELISITVYSTCPGGGGGGGSLGAAVVADRLVPTPKYLCFLDTWIQIRDSR
jgi:hypothetical protein